MSTPAAAAAPPEVAPTAAAAPATAVPCAAAAPAAPGCDNCGASVPGRYCGNCGQRLEPPVHSLRHFLKVATEDLTHADSRVWRTLAALLGKPGFLTREFLAGRRASYLPPVRLYLVLSVVFFVYASASARHDNFQVAQLDAPQQTASAKVNLLDPLAGESAEQRSQRVCSEIPYEGPWQQRLAPLFHRTCLAVTADNGRPLRESFLHNVPRAMFVFLPLLAAAMMLMYWRPRHYYVEHLLLFVHNHAFAFLVLMLAWTLSALLPAAARWVNTAVFWYMVWYVFRSMRVVYGQGRLLTFGKLVLLSFWYLVSGALMLGLTIVYSALTV
ncbi:MAG TPA: DUF3667 domain-containing protein [Steroidobacteraceae bacterium]